MVVQHNLTAMNSNRMLGLTTKSQAKSTERLSSGYKINRAADDAAGLAISEKMRKQIRGLTQASTNAQDGISAVQTAEGALTEVHDMLQRMNELAVKSANGTNSEDDRSYIQSEVDALISEIDRVSTTTKFNEIYLLKGDAEVGTKDVYSYKTVKSESTATVTAANLFDADGNAIADADALKDILDDDPDAKIFTAAGTKAANTDYTKEVTAAFKGVTQLYKADGTAVTAATGSGSLSELLANGTYLYKADHSGDAARAGDVNGTAGSYTAKNDLWKPDGTKVSAGDAITNEEQAVITTWFVADPEVAVKDTDYTITAENYKLKAGTDLFDENGNQLTDATLTATVKAGGGVYKTAPTKATADTDYTYTPGTEGKAQLYDDQGNAVKAADIAEMVEDGKKLYTDKEHQEEAANLEDYTKKATVNEDLVFSLHVGADSSDDNKIAVTIASISAAGIGINDLDVSTEDAATAAIDTISDALKIVSKQRSDLGAIQNRLEHTINNLDNVVENTTSAESQIRDTDMATEMVKYANNNILAQAGQAMLAQANQFNQGVLSLLG